MFGLRIEPRLFGPSSGQTRSRTALRTVGQLAWLMARDLYEGRLNLQAASLVYSTIVAIVPFLAFGVAALKGLGVSGALKPALLQLLEPLGPAGIELAGRAVEFVNHVKVGVLGILGVLLLAFTALSLLRKIEIGLNEAWQVTDPRPLIRRSLEYLGLLVVGPVFLLAAFGLTTSLVNHNLAQALGPLAPVLGRVVPFLITIIAFTSINLITPNTRVRLRPALAAGIAGGIVWQSAGLAFALLAASSTRLSAIYSSFAILILFLVWIYLSWLILLLGARLGFYLQYPAWRTPRSRLTPLQPAQVERAAIDVMRLAAGRFTGSGRSLTLSQVAGQLGLPSLRLKPVMAPLVNAGLLHFIPSRGYVLARAPETITLAEILDAARGRAQEEPSVGLLAEMLAQTDAGRRECLAAIRLSDLENPHSSGQTGTP